MINKKGLSASLLTLTLLTIVASPSSVFAAGSAGSGPNPYRDCGIGAALFSETHWAAVISNVIWDLGTTAVTSATASPETCSGANIETAQFIIDNYDNLVEETAKGQGQHLVAMLDIQGCNTVAQDGALLALRADVAQQVGATSYNSQGQIDKASNYYDAVTSAVSLNCSA